MGLGVIGVFEGDKTADLKTWFFGRPSKQRPPKLFRDSALDNPALDIKGAVVREVSFNLGTYGMGGPGFLGFLLEGPASQKRRWLVITLWNAAGWATLDGALIAEALMPDERNDALKAGREIREFKSAVLNAILTSAACTDDILTLEFERNGIVHQFQIRADGRDVLPWRGSGNRKTLEPGESLRDAVVVSQSGYLWTDDDDDDEEAEFSS